MNDYDFYKSIGVCPDCRKREPEPHRVFCLECLERRRKADKKYRETHKRKRKNVTTERRKQEGICVTCGKRKAVKGKTKCGICGEKARIRERNRRGMTCDRYERPSYGMCYICGSTELYENRPLCKRCYENSCMNIAKGRAVQKENGISVNSQ